METVLILLAVSGVASQYAPGVMPEVINNRQRMGHIPNNIEGYDGYIAVQYCTDVGKTFYLKPEDGSEWEKFLATDCAGIADGALSWMRRNNILVEIDYNTAERWDTVGKAKKIEMLTELQYRLNVLDKLKICDIMEINRGRRDSTRRVQAVYMR